jgi:hypothetical protein
VTNLHRCHASFPGLATRVSLLEEAENDMPDSQKHLPNENREQSSISEMSGITPSVNLRNFDES